MSVIKLAVYGAIGYLVYQTFFAEMPASRGERDTGSGGGSRDRGESMGSSSGMSGGGQGRLEQTAEPMGMSARHRVGRGVI